MISARKIRANRANARSSTGPKTTQGKSRAAQNARRHGLSLSIFTDPRRSAEVENFAREIATENATPETLEFARRIAEAQIDLMRVRQARLDLIARNLNNPDYEPYISEADADRNVRCLIRLARRLDKMKTFPSDIMNNIEYKPRGPKKFAHILSDLTKQLIAMDRYERRALSRRKFAIRALDIARAKIV